MTTPETEGAIAALAGLRGHEGRMKTETQCRLKAAEMRRLAETCEAPWWKVEYLAMSKRWEDIAAQAAWQDRTPPPA